MTCHKHMYSESWHKALNSALLPFSTHCLLDLNVHWKDWCWSWSNTLATWCKELTHWERPWYWEGLRAEEGDEMVGWHHWLNGHVCVCVCVCVTQLCLTLCDPMDCNLPVSSLHGILHARTWVWANSRREWSTGKLGLLQFMGTQLSNWKKNSLLYRQNELGIQFWAVSSEWSENHTKNSCSSSPLVPTFNIFHQVNMAVEASLWGENKAVSLGIISAWVGGAGL